MGDYMNELENNLQEFDENKSVEEKRKFSFLKSKYLPPEEALERKKRRKTITALSTFVIILAAGVVGNWYYQNTDLASNIAPLVSSVSEKTLGQAQLVNATKEPTTESSYFSSARVERQKARDSSLQNLQKVIDNNEENEDVKKQATIEIANISKYISIENKIETLVCAKGISNCVAVVDSDGKRVDVIVDSKELSDTLILQIKDIATSQLKCGFEDVSIIQSK